MVQIELLEAKLNGLDAVRKFVNTYNHNEDYQWALMTISDQTADKLLKGEFKTFEALEEFRRNDLEDVENLNIEVLYREIYNQNREESIYIIETIFINE
jgi:hypothetical protein